MHDGKVLPQLLHGKEAAVWGDAAYVGQGKVIEQNSPWAQDLTQQRRRGYKYLSQRQRELPYAVKATRLTSFPNTQPSAIHV